MEKEEPEGVAVVKGTEGTSSHGLWDGKVDEGSLQKPSCSPRGKMGRGGGKGEEEQAAALVGRQGSCPAGVIKIKAWEAQADMISRTQMPGWC